MNNQNDLFSKSHDEVVRSLSETTAPVYVLVNPIEYHGPHLSLYNDALLSLELSKHLHKRLQGGLGPHPYLLATSVLLGGDPAPGPGTINTPYPNLKEHLSRVANSLIKLGAKQVVFMTFHGAPLHNLAIDHAIQRLNKAGIKALSPFNVVLEKLLTFDSTKFERVLDFLPEGERGRSYLKDLSKDFHAGFFETSIALYLCPDSVSDIYRDLPPCPPLEPDAGFTRAAKVAKKLKKHKLASELEFAATGLAWNRLKPHPGYTGEPALASADAGEYFVEDHVLPYFEKAVISVLKENATPPAPIMGWTEKLSFGGRIAP